MQTELELTFPAAEPALEDRTPRAWHCRFSYQKYVRWRGVIVNEQVRETLDIIATSESEARGKMRDHLGSQFMAEYDRLQRNIANLHEGEKLTRINTLNIIQIYET
ncbi:MAG: hypothetical protein ACTHKU_17435 [Verrucomicrobiota bacterium]